jgi:hypothetical protein
MGKSQTEKRNNQFECRLTKDEPDNREMGKVDGEPMEMMEMEDEG